MGGVHVERVSVKGTICELVCCIYPGPGLSNWGGGSDRDKRSSTLEASQQCPRGAGLGFMMAKELEERFALVEYLSDKDTPLYTLNELADLIQAFLNHLQCNKEALIRTGRYRIDFRRSWWMHASLTNLYYTKLPPRGEFIQLGWATKQGLGLDPCGRHSPLDLYTANCYHTSGRDCKFNGIETPDCGYLEAHNFGLDPADAKRIETHREKFYDTKLRVLNILLKAVVHPDSSNIWPECWMS